MAPRGIASAIMMGVASQILARGFNVRWVIGFGLFICAYTTWIFSCMSLDTGMQFILILGFVQGMGMGCFFMPLSTIVYSNLPRSSIAEASGLFSFGRNIGNAIGISLLTTYIDRDTQFNWHTLSAHVQAANPNLTHWLKTQNLHLSNPHTYAMLANEISTQATFIAYTHAFRIAAIVLFVALFLVMLLRTPAHQKAATLATETAH
jgi:DHA2 family multidrug resistance protein